MSKIRLTGKYLLYALAITFLTACFMSVFMAASDLVGQILDVGSSKVRSAEVFETMVHAFKATFFYFGPWILLASFIVLWTRIKSPIDDRN